MKTNLLIITLLATILSFAISCRKENENISTSQINVPKFLDCYNSNLHDSTTVTNKLIGTWVWQEQSCFNNSSAASSSKVVKATFDSSGLFTVIENSNVITLGHWNINRIDNSGWGVDSNLFVLVIDKPSVYLNGLILLCGNQVLFSDSYVDGCNILFKKD